jgi:hypothetical protein
MQLPQQEQKGEPKKVKVKLADKSSLTTAEIGTFAGKLPRVLYCPQFASPLLSISQLYRDDKSTIFHPKLGIMVANADCMDVRINGTPWEEQTKIVLKPT